MALSSAAPNTKGVRGARSPDGRAPPRHLETDPENGTQCRYLDAPELTPRLGSHRCRNRGATRLPMPARITWRMALIQPLPARGATLRPSPSTPWRDEP